MANKLKLYKQKFINNFMMPKEIKKKIAERNLKVMIKVSLVIFILSILSLISMLFSPDSKSAETKDYIFHYASMTIVEFFSCVLSFCVLKIKKLPKNNLLLVLNFACIEFSSYLIFTYGVVSFNSLIIFISLATINVLIFAIEPLYFMIIIFTFGFMVGPRFVELYGANSASNGFVYLIIMAALSMARWHSVKKNEIYEFETKERERQIQKELEMAAIVQKSFYQHNLTGIEKWEVAYYNNPMLSVSGDLFDFFVRQNKLSGLCIFDVSGHGLASGLVTMLAKNIIEEEFYENGDVELDFTMRRINARVNEEKGHIENYMTGILLRFVDDNIEMVNAGHPNAIVYHASTDSCEYFKCDKKDIQGAIGLGNTEFDFKTLTINPQQNDRLILYTDGVTEAKNILNEEYGKERFLASVQKHKNLDVGKQITAIVDDITQFIGTSPRTDDISIIIIEKK